MNAYTCDQCGSLLYKVGSFYICPMHGQKEVDDSLNFSENIVLEWQNLSLKLPAPLSIQCRWLAEEMKKQQTIGVTWQLRDCYEFLIRFLAIVGIAELLNLNSKDIAIGRVADILLKPQGLSLGDWWAIVDSTFTSLRKYNREKIVFPEILDLIVTEKGKKTEYARILGAGNDNVINWRNRVFGHGIFKRDLKWYFNEAMNWIQPFHKICLDMVPIFMEWEYKNEDGIMWINNKKQVKRLALSPLILHKDCKICLSHNYFFIEKVKFNSKTNSLRTFYIDYMCGSLSEIEKQTSLNKIIKNNNIKDFKWYRSHYDANEYDNWINSIKSDFSMEYIPCDEYLQDLHKILDVKEKGYCWINGPEGVGKTYLAESFMRTLQSQGFVVLKYHILFGQFSDYRTFIVELAHMLRTILPKRTQEIQTNSIEMANLRDQFVEFLSETMIANNLDSIILIIDGINEIKDYETSVLDILPNANELPEGAYIFLVGRDQMSPNLSNKLRRLELSDDNWSSYKLEPNSEINEKMLTTYICRELGEEIGKGQLGKKIIDYAAKKFLYVRHFCKALESSTLTGDELPKSSEFYTKYFNALKKRIGESLFYESFFPLLLTLASVKERISLDCLEFWGFSREQLRIILFELRDFIHIEYNESGVTTFRLAQKEFLVYLISDEKFKEQLLQIHLRISRLGIESYSNKWDKIELDQFIDLYYLCYLIQHIEDSDPSLLPALLSDQKFGSMCLNVSREKIETGEYSTALKLLDNALLVWEWNRKHSKKFDDLYYETLMLKGHLLKKIGEYNQALTVYQNVIEETFSKSKKLVYEACLLEALMEKQWILDILGDRSGSIETLHELVNISSSTNSIGILANAYLSLAWYYHFTDVNKALYWLQKSQTYLPILNEQAFSVKADLMLARVYASSGDLKLSVEKYKDIFLKIQGDVIFDLLQDNKFRLLVIEIVVGLFDYGDFEGALRMMDLLNKYIPKEGIFSRFYLYIWKARILCAIGDYEKALNTIEKAEEWIPYLNNSRWLKFMFMSIKSIVLEEIGSHEEADSLRKIAFEKATESNDKWVMIDLLVMRARSRLINGNEIEEAYLLLQEALNYAKQSNLVHGLANCYSWLGIYCLIKGKRDDSVKYSEMAVQILKKYEILPSCDEEEIWFNHAYILKKIKDYGDPYQYILKAIAEINRKLSYVQDSAYQESYLRQKKIRKILQSNPLDWRN